eukprot:scaffold5097_cov18-Tisochrysis_lutea.AAC.3
MHTHNTHTHALFPWTGLGTLAQAKQSLSMDGSPIPGARPPSGRLLHSMSSMQRQQLRMHLAQQLGAAEGMQGGMDPSPVAVAEGWSEGRKSKEGSARRGPGPLAEGVEGDGIRDLAAV